MKFEELFKKLFVEAVSDQKKQDEANRKTLSDICTDDYFDSIHKEAVDDMEKSCIMRSKDMDKIIVESSPENDKKALEIFSRKYIESDPVNNPSHYKGKNGIESIDVIEAFSLDFHKGNAVKYVLRSGKKETDKELQDLEKANWYINRAINNLKKQ